MSETTAATDAVAAYMTTDVLCVRDDDPVPDAVRQLVDRGVDGAPVVDANGRLVGMLSASDVMVQDAHVHLPTIITLFGMSAELPGQAARYNRDVQRALASTVGELMAREPRTIAADAAMSDAATLMHDADVSRLPVVDDINRVIGIVARGDVLRYLVGTHSGSTGA
jgi:CBS domain-containing protein